MGSKFATVLIAVLWACTIRTIAYAQTQKETDEGILQQANALTQDEIPALLAKAKAGEAKAALMIGLAYKLGRGMKQDDTEAVIWIRKSAEKGYAPGQKQLANMYYEGRGVAQDYLTALKWFEKAADQGYAAAQYDLGVMYRRGQGVILDAKQAMDWYRKAAEGRDPDAPYCIGTMYANGEGVDGDDNEAMKWFRIAAQRGNKAAKAELLLDEWHQSGSAWLSEHHKQHPDLVKVAAGQDVIKPAAKSGQLPNPQRYDTWTLWRTPSGDFEVEGEWPRETGGETTRYWMSLNSHLDPLYLRVFEAGLTCSSSEEKIECEMKELDGQSLKASAPVEGNRTLFLPDSVFFLSSIARKATSKHAGRMELLSIQQGDERRGLLLSPRNAEVECVGQEDIVVDNKKVRAEKFELHTQAQSEFHRVREDGLLVEEDADPNRPFSPFMQIWCSSEGIVLAVEVRVPNEPKDRIELAHFEKYRDF
jgi:TPR repeat protein